MEIWGLAAVGIGLAIAGTGIGIGMSNQASAAAHASDTSLALGMYQADKEAGTVHDELENEWRIAQLESDEEDSDLYGEETTPTTGSYYV